MTPKACLLLPSHPAAVVLGVCLLAVQWSGIKGTWGVFADEHNVSMGEGVVGQTLWLGAPEARDAVLEQSAIWGG